MERKRSETMVIPQVRTEKIGLQILKNQNIIILRFLLINYYR